VDAVIRQPDPAADGALLDAGGALSLVPWWTTGLGLELAW
jgi:hypothetical protein